MRLEPVCDAAVRDRVLRGDADGYDAAPGWPHEDSGAGLSFLDTGGAVYLVIDDHELVAGECGTKSRVDARGTVEIGYGLAAPSRGRGLGSAAVAALVDILRADPSVKTVEAEVHQGNDPSWRILQRLGFRPTGTVINGFSRFSLNLAG
jgi:RimJ/RimL family protein N-acetyltransferase